MTDPLRCPFCHSEKARVRPGTTTKQVQCLDCGAEGPEEAADEQAVVAWNLVKREPREPLEIAEVAARRLADLISKEVPAGWLFSLMLWSVGKGGYMTYIANCQRGDVEAGMVELLRRWKEGRPGG